LAANNRVGAGFYHIIPHTNFTTPIQEGKRMKKTGKEKKRKNRRRRGVVRKGKDLIRKEKIKMDLNKPPLGGLFRGFAGPVPSFI